tara:strand:+ start:1284 stop:1586 length:303 start_codon:yes stop_codon:yes gene_type:complete
LIVISLLVKIENDFFKVLLKKRQHIRTIDLHLIRHKQAIIKVKEALAEEQTKGSFSLTIITGNSSLLQKRILNEILEDSPYTYYIPSWNLGQIIVEYMEL